MSKPLCIDLFCGLGGWTEGFLAEGYDVVGFDIEQHVYGEERYPAQLVLQDVRTIHGKQFKDADMIVASSPCQAYSYMGMPWQRAKQIGAALRGRGDFPDGYTGARSIAELNDLFEQPKRIQREASAAAGRYIPLIQENVNRAQEWVGRAQGKYGSFYLWGDVPALMPTPVKGGAVKNPGEDWNRFRQSGEVSPHWRMVAGQKNAGGSWFNIGSSGQKVTGKNPVHELGRKGEGGGWFGGNKDHALRNNSSHSIARKRASALVAKIPFPLSSHIARVYKPRSTEADAA